MSDNVQFDTDLQGQSYSRPGSRPGSSGGLSGYGTPGMAGWLMRHGWAKSPKSAQMIMAAVIIVDLVGTFVIIKYFL